MPELDCHIAVRKTARAFEEALPPDQRKRLGQFFTGLRLGKLLAHLALSIDTRTVLDPMAGHGDLLDAAWQAARERGMSLARLDGIEIEPETARLCLERLDTIIGDAQPARTVVLGSAFDERQLSQLIADAYDLVITNPPYVRYQGRSGNAAGTDTVRMALKGAIEARAAEPVAFIWKTLADGYSGFSDLSVPSWLLAGLMVRSGGRLALVAPATWRSRDYADVVRYLLLRCFALEAIIEDTQPGWFSDALVRTHLIVARRLDDDVAATSLGEREHWPSAKWIRVSPRAADEHSLTGAAFASEVPEAGFASWVKGTMSEPVDGIEVASFDLAGEWAALQARARRQRWYKMLEAGSGDLPLFGSAPAAVPTFLPPPIKAMLPDDARSIALLTLEQAGIHVGQGLRTGCNAFFYVEACGPEEGGMVPVRGAAPLGAPTFLAPAGALRPVVRRQADVQSFANNEGLRGRVLDLQHWVLPEDHGSVQAARSAYEAIGEQIPRPMPDDLAAFVRRAATQAVTGSYKQIPELTAVRTNIRQAGRRGLPPRFWYMLPDFAPRHLPAAFIPRVIHRVPWAECNSDPAVLIDANFSTFWPRVHAGWTPHSLKALLNSIWCRTFMELLGTPLGGGALKLEATHLRHMVVPRLDDAARHALAAAGKHLTRDSPGAQTEIDAIVLGAVVRTGASVAALSALAQDMAAHARQLRGARQKAAS
ncbi:MAG: N-6 DNA methylase [Steroidobacteraceae bacterium]